MFPGLATLYLVIQFSFHCTTTWHYIDFQKLAKRLVYRVAPATKINILVDYLCILTEYNLNVNIIEVVIFSAMFNIGCIKEVPAYLLMKLVAGWPGPNKTNS